MVNKFLIRPYFWGGYVRGDRFTSHNLSVVSFGYCIVVYRFELSGRYRFR